MLNKLFGRKASSGLENDVPSNDLHEESKEYWTDHNVTLHQEFSNKEESLEYFHWRNDQYFKYIDLMPVSGFDGKVLLDFGCGPGHDLVGFGTYSNCQKLVGVDVSTSSVKEAQSRLNIHGIQADVQVIDSQRIELPFQDATFDHIHSSGVLHHTPDPVAILKELKRVLKPGGTMNIMVYNYNSLWVHLYVAYERAIVNGLFRDEPLRDQFRRSTDGEDCPISNCYRSEEWIALCNNAGLSAEFSGASASVFELSILEKRFAAIMDRRLSTESRNFLTSLTFDQYGIPYCQGQVAGIDACFKITRPYNAT